MVEVRRQLLLNPKPNEFKGLMVVSPLLADGYGHVNNAAYLTLFEQQRARYIECAGFTLDVLEQVYRLRAFLTYGEIKYMRQVFPGDLIMVHTSAHVGEGRENIIFNQEIYRQRKITSQFDCIVGLVNSRDRSVRVPENIAGMINNATFLQPARRPTTLILPAYMQ